MEWMNNILVLYVCLSGGMHVVRQTASVSQLGLQQVEISPVYFSQGLFSTSEDSHTQQH